MAKSDLTPPLHIRVTTVLFAPIFLSIIVGGLLNRVLNVDNPNVYILGGVGILSLLLGLRWYDVSELGMRFGRNFLSGIGFAFLGWISFLFARFIAIKIGDSGRDLGITFLYLLIFEAFCVQLWVFGLFFKLMAEWRNPLSATLTSGVLFGFTAHVLFSESYGHSLGLVYFIFWGWLYAIIRLRTGSFLGMMLIQAIQTLTVWYLVRPGDGDIAFNYLYGIGCLLYALIIWRLLPKYTSDYRV